MTPRVAALVLAAGRSTRMGGPNKLLATFDGVPLVRRSVETALASRAARTVVVLGHQASAIRAALDGVGVRIEENPDFAEGLSTSLRLGFPVAAEGADGVLVMLADQPALEPRHLNDLIEAFRPQGPGSIVVAMANGVRGNPVVLSRDLGDAIGAVTGDRGAREMIMGRPDLVRAVELGHAASLDVDTPGALSAAGGILCADAVPGRS